MFSHHNGSGSCGLLAAADTFKGCFRPPLVSPDVISPSSSYSTSAKDGNCMEMKGKVLSNIWDQTSGSPSSSSSAASSRFSLPAPPPQFYFDTKYAATRSIRSSSSFQLYHSKGFKITVPEDGCDPASSPSSDLHPHHAKLQRPGHQQPDSPFRSLRQGTRLHKTSFLANGRYYPSAMSDDPTRRSGPPNPAGIYPYMRLGTGRPSVNRSFFRALAPRPILPTDRWPLPPPPPPPSQQHFEGLWVHPSSSQKQFYGGGCSSDHFQLMTSTNDKMVSPHQAALETLLNRKTFLQRGQPNSKDSSVGGKHSTPFRSGGELLQSLRPNLEGGVHSDMLQTSAIASLSYLCSGLSSDKLAPTTESDKDLLLTDDSPSNCRPPGFGARSPLGTTLPAASSTSDAFFFFARGSLIQLADGTLKRVEDLETNDFFQHTGLDGSMKIDISKVEEIRKIDGTGEAVLCFRVGAKQTRATFRVPTNHPFFVYNRGWSSCDPGRTRATYGLDCRPLNTGDPCVSLTQIMPQRSHSSSPVHPSPSSPQTTRTPSSATSQPSEYSSQHHTSLWQPQLAAAAIEDEDEDDEDEEEGEEDAGEDEERLSSSVCVDAETTPAAGPTAELKVAVENETEEEAEVNVDKEDDEDAPTIPVSSAIGRADGTPGDDYLQQLHSIEAVP